MDLELYAEDQKSLGNPNELNSLLLPSVAGEDV